MLRKPVRTQLKPALAVPATTKLDTTNAKVMIPSNTMAACMKSFLLPVARKLLMNVMSMPMLDSYIMDGWMDGWMDGLAL